MGRKFKFAKTELQYSGQNAKPKYMVIEFLPEQVGTLTYTGEELFPTWKNLDPLKVQIEGEVSAVNAGKHYITVTPTGIFAWPDMTQTPKQIEYVIDRAVIDKVPTQKGTLTFNNAQQSPEWNDFDASKMVIGGVYQNQIHKGTYKATFTPDDNHCWADKTFDAKEVSWEIKVLTLTKPALQTTSYPYTGSAITPTITNFNANFMSKSGDTQATNKGNYTITIGLLYADDTCWTGGGTANFNLTWAITALEIPRVTANVTRLDYNKQSQEPQWQNFDTRYIEKIGDSHKDAGDYTTTFAIKDAYKANMQWQGGGTADITISWKVARLQVTAPTLNTKPVYDGGNIYPSDLDWSGYDEDIMRLTDEPHKDANPLPAAAYQARWDIIDNNCYFPGYNTWTTSPWRIEKAVIPANWMPSWTENPINLTWEDYFEGKTVWDLVRFYINNWDAGMMTLADADRVIDGYGYINLVINPDSNHTWSDGSTSGIKSGLNITAAAAPEWIQCQCVPNNEDASRYNYGQSNSIVQRAVNREGITRCYFVIPKDWELSYYWTPAAVTASATCTDAVLPGRSITGTGKVITISTKDVTTGSNTVEVKVSIKRNNYETTTYTIARFTVN